MKAKYKVSEIKKILSNNNMKIYEYLDENDIAKICRRK